MPNLRLSLLLFLGLHIVPATSENVHRRDLAEIQESESTLCDRLAAFTFATDDGSRSTPRFVLHTVGDSHSTALISFWARLHAPGWVVAPHHLGPRTMYRMGREGRESARRRTTHHVVDAVAPFELSVTEESDLEATAAGFVAQHPDLEGGGCERSDARCLTAMLAGAMSQKLKRANSPYFSSNTDRTLVNLSTLGVMKGEVVAFCFGEIDARGHGE